MKQKGSGFWKKEVNEKLLAVGAAVLLALLLIPLLRIMEYAAPWYDDYTYGKFVKNFYVETHSLLGVLQGALYCAKSSWFAWQGTFSSIFLMALMPGTWGEDKYFLGPLLILLLLLTGVFVLVRVLVRDVLKGSGWSCLFFQCATAGVTVVLMHTAQTGIYWYNAAVHYIAMHGFAILLTAALVKLYYVRSRIGLGALTAGSVILAVLAGGSNFVTSLQGLLLVLTIIGMGAFFRRKRAWLCLPAALVYCGAFFLNVSAPGNAVRQTQLTGMGMGPLPAIGHSFLAAFSYIWKFGGLITLVVLLALAPVLWNVVRKSPLSFRLPGLVSLYSFCLFAAGFAPSFYSLGHEGLGRTLNAVKLTYQLLLILNEGYWLDWLCRKAEQRAGEECAARCYWWLYPLAGAAMLLVFAVSPNQAGNYSSYGAFYYVRTGEAYNFHQQYLERVALLNSDAETVVVEPYRFKPWLICAGDLSDNPEAEENRAIADWYGKQSVVCRESGPED